MGDNIGAGGSGGALRSMSNPNLFGDADTFLGTNWYTGSGDNGGVEPHLWRQFGYQSKSQGLRQQYNSHSQSGHQVGPQIYPIVSFKQAYRL